MWRPALMILLKIVISIVLISYFILEMQDQPSILSLIRSPTSSSACRPYISDSGSMLGFLQCLIIGSNGGEYEESIKAIPPLEKPSDSGQPNKEEDTSITSCIKNDFELVKDFIKKDYQKEFVFSIHDAPGAQQSKQFYLNYIEVLFKESTKGGGNDITHSAYLYVYTCTNILLQHNVLHGPEIFLQLHAL